MSAPSVSAPLAVEPEAVFQQIEAYPWSSDREFQSGLRSILRSNPPREQVEILTLRAKCFYFSRKNRVNIDFAYYRTWHARHFPPLANGTSNQTTISASPPLDPQTEAPSSHPNGPLGSDTSASSDPSAPYPTSFGDIVQLITTGQPVPGIKEIPDTVLAGQESQATTAKRKKPWEEVRSEPQEPIEVESGT